MSRHASSLGSAYFNRLYAGDIDPWKFATSEYEREKYAATLAALPVRHYGAALEVGCSIGVLTKQLAAKCADLLAIDIAAVALEAARERCRAVPHVRFSRAGVPADWPDGIFDLVLLSEVVYYLDRADVGRLAARVSKSLAADGDIVLVHWLGETHYPLTGDEAADLFIHEMRGTARIRHQSRTARYRLDVLGAA